MMDWSQLYRNPFLTVYLTALFAGGGVGSLVRSLWTHKDPVIAASLFTALSLAAFSAGILLSPGLMPLSPAYALPFAVACIVGILSGFSPLKSLPVVALCLVLLYGSLFPVLNEKRGFPLHEGDARLTVLRTFEGGGGSIELQQSGRAEIFRVRTDSILLEGRLLAVNRYLPWPHGAYLHLERVAETPPAGGSYILNGSDEGSEAWRALLKKLLHAGGILSSTQKNSDLVELRLLESYRVWQEGKEIAVDGLSFPAQKADTGE